MLCDVNLFHRRLVTWYGYETLLGACHPSLEFNLFSEAGSIELNEEFDDEILDKVDEVRAAIPMRIRVASYVHDDGCPDAFPTLVIEGEMAGEGWRFRNEDDPAEDGDLRFMDGSVSLLHDGSVRWSTVCLTSEIFSAHLIDLRACYEVDVLGFFQGGASVGI